MYVRVNVCIHVCMCECMHVCLCVYMYVLSAGMVYIHMVTCVRMCVHAYLCMHVSPAGCVCVCVTSFILCVYNYVRTCMPVGPQLDVTTVATQREESRKILRE